jgi:prepilin-type N-terminal cleavage/methylation domain-containing protein
MSRHTGGERGLTLVEVMIAIAILALVAGSVVHAWRALAAAPTAAAEAARDSAANVNLVKLLDELRSAVAFTEATETSVTFIASTVSGAQAQIHTDPATGQQATLRRYTVRYVFRNGTLYRDTGDPPAWAALRQGAVGMPGAPEIGRPPQSPGVPFPGQRPATVSDPGPRRYIHVHQGRTHETVFSGMWLHKHGTSGLATTHVGTRWEQRYMGTDDWGNAHWQWVAVHYTAGPTWIDIPTFNAVRGNPVRNSDGSKVGYRVTGEIWASPHGMDHIAARPVHQWICTAWFIWCTHGYWRHIGFWVLGNSNELAHHEYSATRHSPMTAQRWHDHWATVVDPEWQRQHDAHQQYVHNAGVWGQRYNAWVGYYREYGRWQDQATMAMEATGAMREVGVAALANLSAEQAFRPRTQPRLSGDARPVGSFARVRFAFFDRHGNLTSNVGAIRRTVIHYQTGRGSASTGVVIGGEGAAADATRPVGIPEPCDRNPAYCPPRPPSNDPTWPEYEAARAGQERRVVEIEYSGPSGTAWGLSVNGRLTIFHNREEFEKARARERVNATASSNFTLTDQWGLWQSDHAMTNHDTGETRARTDWGWWDHRQGLLDELWALVAIFGGTR